MVAIRVIRIYIFSLFEMCLMNVMLALIACGFDCNEIIERHGLLSVLALGHVE